MQYLAYAPLSTRTNGSAHTRNHIYRRMEKSMNSFLSLNKYDHKYINDLTHPQKRDRMTYILSLLDKKFKLGNVSLCMGQTI